MILHTEAPPRVPGCELRGSRPHDYGRGRVCALPGCATILRRTHAGPVCDPCQDNHRCGPLAPAVRATKEEEMGKESLREAVLQVFACDPSRCFNAGDVVGYSGVSPSCVYKNLNALAASGEIVKDAPGVYHWPKIEDAKTAPASPPAPAPVTTELDPEQLANEAPASELLRPQARLAPFAGIDYELHVIGALVSQIESLSGHETRIRVAAYVAARFL